MKHDIHRGYEDAAFFGRNCQSCLRLDQGTPRDAAYKLAATLEGSYVFEEPDGWTVYIPEIQHGGAGCDGVELPPEYRAMMRDFFSTPIEEHIERWKKGIRWRDRNKS